MAVTVSNFRIFIPQFANSSSYPDDVILFMLDQAALRMNADIWGEYYDQGQMYLAAHLLALGAIAQQSSGSNTGGITGVNIAGQASLQFGQNAATRGSSGYSATRYGVEYESLLKLVTAGSVRIY